jgi:hypothetical protein
MNHDANGRELEGRVALVTGVTRRAGIGAAIARELANAGAKLFVAFFRKYDQRQPWGLEASETDALLNELRALSDVCGLEIDLGLPSDPGPTDTGWLSVEQRDELLRCGKLALPVDTARLVRLLTRDDAASVNGQIIRVRPGTVFAT